MKTPRLHCAVVFALFAIPAHAQMIFSPLDATASLNTEATLGVNVKPRFENPVVSKAACDLPKEHNMLVSLDAATLNTRIPSATKNADPSFFATPASFKRVVVNTSGPSPEEQQLAAASAALRTGNESNVNCEVLHLAVIERIEKNRPNVLEILTEQIQANPACACEIVKAAIKATEADVDTVIAIVEAAIHANPESMRIVSQCAIAANPEAISKVQILLAKLDPNSGDSYSAKSAKSAKSGKELIAPAAPPPFNPLDRIYFPEPPPIIPPPVVTSVDSPPITCR